jgi:hypothetical protein
MILDMEKLNMMPLSHVGTSFLETIIPSTRQSLIESNSFSPTLINSLSRVWQNGDRLLSVPANLRIHNATCL